MALQRCKASLGDSAACEQQQAAFVTCSQEHIGLVVGHLVKVADRFCPEEVEAVQRCRTLRPGDDCESEDHDAIRCASLHVLRAAHAKRQAHS